MFANCPESDRMTKLVKDGDELVLPLPAELVEKHRIEEGDDLEIESFLEGKMVLRIVKQRELPMREK
jgi:antitoxin component of MazEF toxin-antitoxin module